jgi:hypothetical protein
LLGREQRRDAEVGEKRAAVLTLQQNVLRLQVAVHDTMLVQMRERVRNGRENPADVARRERGATQPVR